MKPKMCSVSKPSSACAYDGASAPQHAAAIKTPCATRGIRSPRARATSEAGAALTKRQRNTMWRWAVGILESDYRSLLKPWLCMTATSVRTTINPMGAEQRLSTLPQLQRRVPLKPRQIVRMVSLARSAGVHVDFHADRHFHNLRSFPSHSGSPKV